MLYAHIVESYVRMVWMTFNGRAYVTLTIIIVDSCNDYNKRTVRQISVAEVVMEYVPVPTAVKPSTKELNGAVVRRTFGVQTSGTHTCIIYNIYKGA